MSALPDMASRERTARAEALPRIGRSAAILLLCAYQVMVRPFLIGACKYCPTCSNYAIEAIRTRGLRSGTWLTLRRLLRCHPLALGGLDPVPPARSG